MNSKEKAKYLKNIGRRVLELREAQGLSYRELSARCAIDHSKINKIEQGLFNITATTIYELAVGLNVHPSEILNFPVNDL